MAGEAGPSDLTTAGDKLALDVDANKRQFITIQRTGAAAGATLELQMSVNGTDFVPIQVTDLNTLAVAVAMLVDGVYFAEVTGAKKIEVELTAITSGTVSATARLTRAA